MDEVRQRQTRPLEPVHLIVYVDCLVVNVRENQQVINKSLYLALAVTLEGHEELLGMRLAQHEGANFWLSVLDSVTELWGERFLHRLYWWTGGLTGLLERKFVNYHSGFGLNFDNYVCGKTGSSQQMFFDSLPLMARMLSRSPFMILARSTALFPTFRHHSSQIYINVVGLMLFCPQAILVTQRMKPSCLMLQPGWELGPTQPRSSSPLHSEISLQSQGSLYFDLLPQSLHEIEREGLTF